MFAKWFSFESWFSRSRRNASRSPDQAGGWSTVLAWGWCAVLWLVASFVGGAPSWAQEYDPALAELRARLDALEQQNAELRQMLLNPSGLPQGEPRYSVPPPWHPTVQPDALYDTSLTDPSLRAAHEAAYVHSHASDEGSDLEMTAKWNHGLELSTADKAFRVHIGGRTQLDVGWFSVDPNLYTAANGFEVPTPGLGNVYEDGADFRRARLRVDGTMYEQIEWAAEYDFVNSANLDGAARAMTGPTDLWFAFKDVPALGLVKIGNQKEAIGFEHLVSSRFLPFMERSYNQDTFYGGLFNGFNPGVSASGTYGTEEIGTYNLGLFKPTNNIFAYNTGEGDYAVTGRLTRLLFWEDEGSRLVHLGVSLRQATATGTNVGAGSTNPFRSQTFRTRDAIRTGLSTHWPTPANITLFGDDSQSANLEFVVVHHSVTLQAEYLVNGFQDARRDPFDPLGTNVFYHGGYVQLLYYLTGEHDHYGKKVGFFERVKPAENFIFMRDESGCYFTGRGAWQIGARYNFLDLNDEGLNGGILHNGTLGLNWFLNPNMKLQFNYIATHRDAPLPNNLGDGWIHGWGMRVAHDF